MRLSGIGRSVELTNADSEGEGLLKLSVANATGTTTLEMTVSNKHPRATCLTGGRSSCTGGPHAAVSTDSTRRAAIDANGKPVTTDRFSCFGNTCANDQSSRFIGNQRIYSLRLHDKDNSFISLDDIAGVHPIEKIEWSLSPANSPIIITRASDNSTNLGASSTEVYLTNSGVNTTQPVTLKAIVTTANLDGEGSETFSAEIKVENLLSILQVRSMRIRSNGQFLPRDMFGCIGNACRDDSFTSGNDQNNQHALELEVKDLQGNVVAISDSLVRWKVDKPDRYRLSDESGAKRIHIRTLLGDTATSTGTGTVTAWVDGVAGSASLSIGNKHPYQSCTITGSNPVQCVGRPDKQGSPNIFEHVIIDSNGRPIDIDRFSCTADDCEDDSDKGSGSRTGNQHRYSLRVHAQNNSLIGTDKIRQVRWELSESPAFREVQKIGSAGKETDLIVENTNQPGSAILTVFVLPLAGTVQQAQIILVNDVIKPTGSTPVVTPDETCGNGQVDSGEQCDPTSSAWTADQCYASGHADQCTIKDCYQFWETPGTAADPSGKYQYRLSYCVAKKGLTLPALMSDPTEVKDRFSAGSSTPLEEYFYRFTNSTDLIVMRAYRNPNKFSPDVWYARNELNPNQRPSNTIVNGFPAVQDGTGYYISVPVLDTNSSITSYRILNFTTSANPAGPSRAVFTELMRTIRLATPQDDADASAALRRDTQRSAHISFIHDQLEQYRVRGKCNPTCYPALSAGSYTLGQTISGWPSWAQELGKALRASMPLDPSQSTTTPPIVDRGDNVKNVLASKKLSAYTYLHTPASNTSLDKYELCGVYEYPLLSQSKLRRQCTLQSGADDPFTGTDTNSDYSK
ncbi:hypothetical protein HYV71_00800 [Candidatus Uhrbacteria bacterium]|nr:hypothetical protein [Candidatus Uhrbacteria bacterium]